MEKGFFGWHWPILLILGLTVLHWHDAHAQFAGGIFNDQKNGASPPSEMDAHDDNDDDD